MKQIFPLKQDLPIPLDEYSRALFLAEKCGMSYRIDRLDHLNASLTITLMLVDKVTGATVKELTSVTFTPQGRQGAMLNEQAYKDFIQERDSLESQILSLDAANKALAEQIAGMEEGPDRDDLQKDLTKSQADRDALQKDLDKLTPVQPEYEVVDTYEEIVSYIQNGILSSEGIAWGMSLIFQGVPLGALIETP